MKTYMTLATGAGIKAASDFARSMDPGTLSFLIVSGYDLRPAVAAVATAWAGLKFGGGEASITNAAILGGGVLFGSDWLGSMEALAKAGPVGQYAIAAAIAYVLARFAIKGKSAPAGAIVPGVTGAA
jgi:hypothetical protein